MNATALSTTFQVSFPEQQRFADVFDLWHVQEDTLPGATTNRHWLTDATPGSFWSADLPGNPLHAASLLDHLEQQEQRTSLALPVAQQHLLLDLQSLASQDSEPAFFLDAAGQAEDPNNPRSILAAAASYRWPEVSFGLFDSLKLDRLQINSAVDAVNNFIAQVQCSIEQIALVETKIAGKNMALTRVEWGGDNRTYRQAGSSPDDILQHKRVLMQVLAARQNWLNFLLLMSSGALRVSLALATTPFSPVTLWTTWNYLQQIVRLLRTKKL